jgi:hypothetical protein
VVLLEGLLFKQLMGHMLANASLTIADRKRTRKPPVVRK